MTKYIINSGGLRNNQKKQKEFFKFLIKDLGSQPKILICFFAQPREVWEEKFNEQLIELKNIFGDSISPQFELAFPDQFKKQIKNCDVLYIHGGDDHLVQYWLKQFNLPDLWNGKVVATNSASSQALSKYFWTCDWRMCLEGLGILPIKFLAHFKSDYGSNDPRGPINWDNAYKELENYGDKTLPIYALEEGDFSIFEI